MLKVKKKYTDEISTVYAVSGTLFLVYIEGQDPHWEWHDMNDYEPAPFEKMLLVGPGSGKTLAMAQAISRELIYTQPIISDAGLEALRSAITDKER